VPGSALGRHGFSHALGALRPVALDSSMASDLEVRRSTPPTLDHTGSDIGVFFVVVSNHADKPCRLFINVIRVSRSKAATQVYGSGLLAPVTNTNCIRILPETCRADTGDAQTREPEDHATKPLHCHIRLSD
jgi:hypothetical protein